MEEFRIVKDYPNYSVSNFGNVKKNQTGKIIIPRYSNGYSQVELWNNDNRKVFGVHRLVAIEFIPNPENKPFVDHIDNDKANNNVNNLRWATITENNRNIGLSSNNTSGVKGVCWDKKNKKWRAGISIDGKKKNLGSFNTLEEAKQARQNFANKLFGDFTNSCEKIINININIQNVNINNEQFEIAELEKELERIINKL